MTDTAAEAPSVPLPFGHPDVNYVEGTQVDLHEEAESNHGNAPRPPAQARRRSDEPAVLDYRKFIFRSGPAPHFDKIDPPRRGEAPDHDVYLELPADIPFPPVGGSYDGGHDEEQQMHYWQVCAAGQQFFPEQVRMGA